MKDWTSGQPYGIREHQDITYQYVARGPPGWLTVSQIVDVCGVRFGTPRLGSCGVHWAPRQPSWFRRGATQRFMRPPMWKNSRRTEALYSTHQIQCRKIPKRRELAVLLPFIFCTLIYALFYTRVEVARKVRRILDHVVLMSHRLHSRTRSVF